MKPWTPRKTWSTPHERQGVVFDWAKENFGKIAIQSDERAARLIEEAIEVCQVAGVKPETIHAIIDVVYSKPAGNMAREIGGTAITLDAMAHVWGINVQKEADRETRRVLALPREHWQERHAAKVKLGTANLSPFQGCNDEIEK